MCLAVIMIKHHLNEWPQFWEVDTIIFPFESVRKQAQSSKVKSNSW